MTESTIQAMSVIGLVLTIGAFVFAVYQAAKQSKKLEEQTEKLSEITGSLSTRYLGKFPEYINLIGELLKKAKEEILIISTLPNHGWLSCPSDWLEIKHAVDSALNNNIPVNCVFSDRNLITDFTEKQFANHENNWESQKQTSKIKELIKTLTKSDTSFKDNPNITYDQFIKSLVSQSIKELQNTYTGAEVVEISNIPPVYLWMIDNKEAIFCFSTTLSNYSAEAFTTTDARLINALITLHKGYLPPKPSV